MLGARIGVMVGVQVGVACGVEQGAAGPAQTTLTVATVDSADPVLGGANFTYSIQVTNTGVPDATTVAVAITLDAGVTWVSSTGSGWTFGGSGQNRTATQATIVAGAAAPIVVTVTASSTQIADFSTAISVTCANAPTANDTETTENVPTDGPSSWRVPKSAAGFTALGITAPQHLHLAQEASGTLADTIGNMPMTATNAPSYQNTVSGWTRKGVGVNDTTANQGFSAAAGLGPNLGTQSFAYLAYLNIGTSDHLETRELLGVGIADPDTQNIAFGAPTSGDIFTFRSENVTANGVYAAANTNTAVLFVFNRNAGTTKVYTSGGDKIVGTYIGNITDGYKILLGSVPVSSGTPHAVTSKCFYSAWWTGAAAQFTDATATTLMTTMGISALWNVTVDGPTHFLHPLTTADWAFCDTDQYARVGRHLITPNSAWGFQETVSPIADKIGSLDLTVTGGSPTLNAAIGLTGWARKCASFSAGGSAGQCTVAAGVGPNPLTTSVLWVGLWNSMAAATSLRGFMTAGGALAATEVAADIKTIATGSQLQIKALLATTDGAAAFVVGIPMLIALRWNRTAGTFDLFTKDEKITGTYGTGIVTDGGKGFGAVLRSTPACKISHGFMYSGANAEQTDQQVRDMFTTLMRAAPAW